MQINFNINGPERKKLVQAVGEILALKPKYLGMPSAAYEVGGYTISKNGTLSGEVTQELLDALAERGFVDPESGTGFRLEEVTAEPVEIIVPDLAEQRNTDMDYHADFPISPSQVEAPDTISIELPKDGFTDTAIANLEKLVESKAALIKKAIGADSLPVEQTDETLCFPWLRPDTPAEVTKAATQLIVALCNMAKEQKRITATSKAVENEKYAFRCFLLRLGFIGDEYKEARKVLLSQLDGNTAFKSARRCDS